MTGPDPVTSGAVNLGALATSVVAAHQDYVAKLAASTAAASSATSTAATTAAALAVLNTAIIGLDAGLTTIATFDTLPVP